MKLDQASPSKIDLVLVLGDFIVHGLSSQKPETNNWPQMKPLISDQLKYLKAKFPEAVILCTTGNNDAVYYYQAPPNEDVKKLFYGDLYEMWFSGADAPKPNQEYPGLQGVKDTMMDGGYFRWDNIGGSDKHSVISLNTIYYHRLNKFDEDTAARQLTWLETQLS